MSKAKFSIVIPSYKRIDYLQRLLESIVIQTYKNFEVVITDDSDDDAVFSLLEKYRSQFVLKYRKNKNALGTPENWNEGIRLSEGDWVKLMHDDDWFALPGSLERFAEIIDRNPGADFIFSGSSFIRNNERFDTLRISRWQLKLLKQDPTNLYFENFIGPPSVVVHRNTKKVWYDSTMKWFVDVDFYMRFLQHYSGFDYTSEALINIGYSASQVTEKVLHDKHVYVKENLAFFQKQPHSILKRIWNYDYSWRMIRNFKLKTIDDLKELYPVMNLSIPGYYKDILFFQRHVPNAILKIGFLSKIFMTLSFLKSRLSKY